MGRQTELMKVEVADPDGLEVGNDLFEAFVVFRNGRNLDRHNRDVAHGHFHFVQDVVRCREIEADLAETGCLQSMQMGFIQEDSVGVDPEMDGVATTSMDSGQESKGPIKVEEGLTAADTDAPEAEMFDVIGIIVRFGKG